MCFIFKLVIKVIRMSNTDTYITAIDKMKKIWKLLVFFFNVNTKRDFYVFLEMYIFINQKKIDENPYKISEY